MIEPNKNSGFLIISKPSGPTSFKIISKLRKITGIKKIGHAGTLDPFASGVLICAIGREATKRIKEFVKLDKEYVADIFLGAKTDTYDRTGQVQKSTPITWDNNQNVDREKIKKVIKNFIGSQKQVPPMYSAIKRGGKKLYELARQGIEIERGFSEIDIHEIEIINYAFPILKIKVKCSSGTYIRSLAHDIGEILGCGAYLEELERTAVGDFTIKKAIDIDKVNQENWTTFLFNNFFEK